MLRPERRSGHAEDQPWARDRDADNNLSSLPPGAARPGPLAVQPQRGGRRLLPVALGELGLPVWVHSADPVAFFDPRLLLEIGVIWYAAHHARERRLNRGDDGHEHEDWIDY